MYPLFSFVAAICKDALADCCIYFLYASVLNERPGLSEVHTCYTSPVVWWWPPHGAGVDVTVFTSFFSLYKTEALKSLIFKATSHCFSMPGALSQDISYWRKSGKGDKEWDTSRTLLLSILLSLPSDIFEFCADVFFSKFELNSGRIIRSKSKYFITNDLHYAPVIWVNFFHFSHDKVKFYFEIISAKIKVETWKN